MGKCDIASFTTNVANIRNICVLAHVDHGKTTLIDSLIASNAIISKRMAGKIRYMDSRKDEQQRGITMKCSAIALAFTSNTEQYLINVIDTPGHVDFLGEVSSGIRVSDGAVIVIDAIEGICSQTKTALHHVWIERIKPVLVLNKIDRLFIERKMTPLDIYMHLNQIIEQINALVGELFTCDVLGKCEIVSETSNHNEQQLYDWNSGIEDVDDSSIYFTPESGNVIFASAIDGWGFSIKDFSKFLSVKYGISESVLNKTLWGDFYLNSKEKKIMKGALNKARKPLFVTMVLENIHVIYDTLIVKRDKALIEKITNSLGIKLTNRDKNSSDFRGQLQSILSQWLPLSDAVLNMVCNCIPSPLMLSEERVESLMCSNIRTYDSLPPEAQKLKNDFIKCSNNNSPLIICVSKMFPFEKKFLPQFKQKPLSFEEISLRRQQIKNKLVNETQLNIPENNLKVEKFNNGNNLLSNIDNNDCNENDDSNDNEISNETVFIAFARIFSGTVKTGDIAYVLGPKHNPSKISSLTHIDPKLTINDLPPDQHITVCQIKDLYLLMGKELELIDEVCAGNIFGISGLENHILKSATISNNIYCSPFIDLHMTTVPILRVALEPQNPTDMQKLIKGLKMLNQADPCVEVKIQETGEHVIITTGEVHLQRCIDDLVSFSGIQINCSSPIVPFRETIISKPKRDMVNEVILEQNNSYSAIELLTPNKKSKIKIFAKPLPENVVKLLCENRQLLKILNKHKRETITECFAQSFNEFKQHLEKEFCDADWPENIINKIWSFGPKHCGPNILINNTCNFHILNNLFNNSAQNFDNLSVCDDLRRQYNDCFISGFQLMTSAGPLCDEPLMGVCFIVDEWTINDGCSDNINDPYDPYGPLSGQIMSTVKECCKKAFQARPQRLMAAMFSSSIQVDGDVLGKLYAVIGRRHGRILHGDVQEGSQTFNVTAILPVIESFDFANEIRKQTSGKACPQLLFSHWEIIDIDPFWVPTTQEEYALFGEKADTENRALKYMNSVRRRKGLHVDEKIVEHAEKQRTLTKNK